MDDEHIRERYDHRTAWLIYVDGWDKAEAKQEARRRLRESGVAQERITELTEKQ